MRRLTRLLTRAAPPAAAPAVLELTDDDRHRPESSGPEPAKPEPVGPDFAPLLAEIGLLAEYVGRLRREIGRLGPDRLAGAVLPAARDDLAALRRETMAAADAIRVAADAILAVQPEPSGSGSREVARRAAAIRDACAFGAAADRRLGRTASVLDALEQDLARVGRASAPPAGDLREA